MTQTCFLAIEIGGTKLQVVLGDEQGHLIEKHRFVVEQERGAEGIRQTLRKAIRELTGQPRAAGVGFGGPVDAKTGTIAASHQIEGWSGFALADWLHAQLGIPIFVENDANVAALGEATYGAGRGHNPVFYVTLGSGVGGGLVAGGQLYHGASPGEAEIGHIRLDRSGATLESACSGWAVDRKVRQAITEEPDSLLAQLVGKNTTGEARFLGAAITQGDQAALGIVRATAEDLAFGLSHVVHLFHPEVIVLGGGLSLVGEPLQQAVAEALPRFLMKAFQPGPQIRLAALGEEVVPVGALALARQYYGQLKS